MVSLNTLSLKKKIAILVAVCLAVFLILDFSYVWANVKFMFRGNKNTNQSGVATTEQSQKIMEPNLLIIDSLGIQAPVIYISEKTEKAYQAALINGVVHFPGTANPGQSGNVYIFGHSSDFFWSKGHYKSIFAVLPRIQKGAPIVLSDGIGEKFVYTVTDSHEVASNDLSVLDQGGNKKKLLTLQTSYPVGTALARWVVVAELK